MLKFAFPTHPCQAQLLSDSGTSLKKTIGETIPRLLSHVRSNPWAEINLAIRQVGWQEVLAIWTYDPLPYVDQWFSNIRLSGDFCYLYVADSSGSYPRAIKFMWKTGQTCWAFVAFQMNGEFILDYRPCLALQLTCLLSYTIISETKTILTKWDSLFTCKDPGWSKKVRKSPIALYMPIVCHCCMLFWPKAAVIKAINCVCVLALSRSFQYTWIALHGKSGTIYSICFGHWREAVDFRTPSGGKCVALKV